MRASDAIQHLGLAIYPLVGLLSFFSVFVAVSWRALRAKKSEMKHHAALPLEDLTERDGQP